MHAAELYQQALVQAEAVRSSGTVEQFAFADVSSSTRDFFRSTSTLDEGKERHPHSSGRRKKLTNPDIHPTLGCNYQTHRT